MIIYKLDSKKNSIRSYNDCLNQMMRLHGLSQTNIAWLVVAILYSENHLLGRFHLATRSILIFVFFVPLPIVSQCQQLGSLVLLGLIC